MPAPRSCKGVSCTARGGGGGCRGVASFACAQRRSRACRGRVQWSMKRLVAVFRGTMPVIPAPTQRHPPGRSPDGTRSLPHVPTHFTHTSIAPPHTPRVALQRRLRVRVRPTRPSWGPRGRGRGRASIAPFNVRRKGSWHSGTGVRSAVYLLQHHRSLRSAVLPGSRRPSCSRPPLNSGAVCVPFRCGGA